MPNIDSDSLNNPAINFENRSTDPTAPGVGRGKLFLKDDIFYVLLDTGSAVAVGGAVALTEGQLAVGNGSNILSALPVGTEGQVVTADPSGHATWDDLPVGGGGDLALIQQVEVGAGGAAYMEVTAIAGTYQTLVVEYTGRGTASAELVNLGLTLNGDATAIYDSQYTQIGNATTTGAGAVAQTNAFIGYVVSANASANYPTAGRLTIPHYARTVFYKQGLGTTTIIYGTAVGKMGLIAFGFNYRSTAAVTAIRLTPASGNWVEGSVLAVYGQG